MSTAAVQQQEEELLVTGQDVQEPCPEGTHPAICVDVFAGENDFYEDRKDPSKTNEVQTVWLVFQVFPKDEEGNLQRQGDGRCFQVERKFTRSITPKSKLCEFLEAWRGAKFTPEQRAGFNLMKLKGVGATINVEQKVYGENVYANLTDEIELLKDAPKAETYVRGDYSKRTNKNKRSNGQAETTVATVETADGDALPF